MSGKGKAATQPPSHPATQPPSHPATQPPSHPASHPVNEPVCPLHRLPALRSACCSRQMANSELLRATRSDEAPRMVSDVRVFQHASETVWNILSKGISLHGRSHGLLIPYNAKACKTDDIAFLLRSLQTPHPCSVSKHTVCCSACGPPRQPGRRARQPGSQTARWPGEQVGWPGRWSAACGNAGRSARTSGTSRISSAHIRRPPHRLPKYAPGTMPDM